jgi:hypothetical protein
MRSSRISLYIEELVLHGFGAGSGDRIKSAVESELARLIEERGLPARMSGESDVSSLAGGSFSVGEDIGIDAVGAQVAHSIFDALGGRPGKGG